MHPLELFLIALSMAVDAFTVSLGAGTLPQVGGARPTFRLAFHFGLFQALFPIIGYLAGVTILPLIAAYDHWVAFALLAFVGLRMLRSAIGGGEHALPPNPSRGLTLIVLSIAVSIDALAIGLTLALLRVTIWYPALVIGLVTGVLSWLGLRIGNHLGKAFGRRVGAFGGAILLLIGLRILLVHLAGGA